MSEGQRAKRQKIDRHGRLSAFEKLKQLKGSKHKYEVNNVENVYDTIDESEYTEKVLQRQEENWIEDDGGGGYVEDGREIFDDDEGEDMSSERRHGDKNVNDRSSKRKAKLSAQAGSSSGKGSIKSFISNMPAKKKEDIKTSDDDILSDIMGDLDSEQIAKRPIKPANAYKNLKNVKEASKKDAQDYFKSLSTNFKKPPVAFSGHIEKPANKEIEVSCSAYQPEPEITDVPSPKKSSQRSVSIFKLNAEPEGESPTQVIDEFDTQDFHFDNGDFEDSIPNNKENLPRPNTNKDGESANVENLEQFMMDDFDICIENKTEKAKPIIAWSGNILSNGVESIKFDGETLPLSVNKDGDKVLNFYWWDAWEDRFIKPGVVYLFGKVYVEPGNRSKGCVSCCLIVKNINRKLYLLPREYKLNPVTLEEDVDSTVSMMDVYEEFNTKVSASLDLKEFKSRSVTKNYAFGLPNIPTQSEYLEVKYSALYPPPPNEKPYSTFSHIFGTTTSSLETFLLERKIKGPCWLEVKMPEQSQSKVSWSKLEVSCEKMEYVSVQRSEKVVPPPPLIVATINMRTVMDPKTKNTKIVMISCLVHNQFEVHKPPPDPPFQTHFCVFTRGTEIWPMDLKQAMTQYKGTALTKCETERELLSYFLVQFWKIDADMIVGHDLQGYQQDLLIGNILDHKIPNWSRLGRLKRSIVPQKKYAGKDAFLGRLVCDLKISAMELIKSRSFDLETLCTTILKLKEGERTDIISEDVFKYYSTSRDLFSLVSLTMQDTSYILKMMCELNVIPLALQITQIAGNVMSRTLLGGRSERNEYLLLHAFTEKEYIVPDKIFGKKISEIKEIANDEEATITTDKVIKRQGKKKPAYSGGLVLDPKKGFYDKLVLLMDFNSLYPSIIQEFNICFTTLKNTNVIISEEDIANIVLPQTNAEAGVLPTQIRKLVESRREVKKLMKTPDLQPEVYMQYNIRQTALKLTANSMYGCLGFTHSRFYARHLAALVTLKGREILMNTKDIVEKLNYEVIYGDTDSLMINTNCLEYDQVFKIGHELKKEINKKYKQIELDIDGVFRYLLLLKKKKYAAVTLNKGKNGEFITAQEHKGLDIVRRDWSQLAAESGKFILSQILSEQSQDDRIEGVQTHLLKLKEDLLNSKMPLSVLTITKQLTRNPEEYPDKNSQPHVQVALRLNIKSNRRFKKGDIVPYIICQDGTTNAAMQRAYHIEELKNSEGLKVDVDYYLAHQLHPVISRICDPIEGMDAARVADWLGLDPSKYKQLIKREQNNNDDIYQMENEKEKYRQCNDFTFTCANATCKTMNSIRDTFRKLDKETVTFLDRCQNEKCTVSPIDSLGSIQNQLTRQIRLYHTKYYENWLICEDPACTNRTKDMSQVFMAGYPLCHMCEKGVMFREYTESDLYNQMCFFDYIFDLAKQNPQKLPVRQNISSALAKLKAVVDNSISHAAYSLINLSKLFSIFGGSLAAKGEIKIKSEPVDFDIAIPDSEDLNIYAELGYKLE